MNNQPQAEIATHSEVLEMLTEKAREGSTSAMIALERALRLAPSPTSSTTSSTGFSTATSSFTNRRRAPTPGMKLGPRPQPDVRRRN
jgi:hypothetical protein